MYVFQCESINLLGLVEKNLRKNHRTRNLTWRIDDGEKLSPSQPLCLLLTRGLSDGSLGVIQTADPEAPVVVPTSTPIFVHPPQNVGQTRLAHTSRTQNDDAWADITKVGSLTCFFLTFSL